MATRSKSKNRAMIALASCQFWIIYLRVSVDPDGNIESPVEQLEEVLEWLPEIARPDTLPAEADLDVGDENKGGVTEWGNLLIITEVCSASRYAKKARKWWPKVLEAMATGKYRGVVTWETSRSTRMLEDYTTYRSLLEVQGMWYIASETAYDVTNPDHARTLGMSAVDSEIESMKTSKRTTRTVGKRAKRGRPFGKTPYPFERTHEIVNGKLRCIGQQPHPVRGPMVRAWADGILGGTTTISQISKETGRLRTSIVDTLVSPATAGLRVHNGTVYDGEWEGIVTVDEHKALVRLLKNPSRNSRAHVGAERRHAFTGILHCGKCDAPMYHRKHPNGPRYACNENLCMSVVAKHVDKFLMEGLQTRIDMLTLGPDDGTESERDALLAQIAQLDVDYDEAVEAVRAKEMTAKMAGDIEARIEEDRISLNAKLDKLASPIEIDALVGVDIFKLDPVTDVDWLHEIATRLLDRVIIAPAEKVGCFNSDRIHLKFRL